MDILKFNHVESLYNLFLSSLSVLENLFYFLGNLFCVCCFLLSGYWVSHAPGALFALSFLSLLSGGDFYSTLI